jgi:hypothetical protein
MDAQKNNTVKAMVIHQTIDIDWSTGDVSWPPVLVEKIELQGENAIAAYFATMHTDVDVLKNILDRPQDIVI